MSSWCHGAPVILLGRQWPPPRSLLRLDRPSVSPMLLLLYARSGATISAGWENKDEGLGEVLGERGGYVLKC